MPSVEAARHRGFDSYHRLHARAPWHASRRGPKKAELAALLDVIEAYEAIRWVAGTNPDGKGEQARPSGHAMGPLGA